MIIWRDGSVCGRRLGGNWLTLPGAAVGATVGLFTAAGATTAGGGSASAAWVGALPACGLGGALPRLAMLASSGTAMNIATTSAIQISGFSFQLRAGNVFLTLS